VTDLRNWSLRRTSRPGGPEGEGYPKGKEALEKENELRARFVWLLG